MPVPSLLQYELIWIEGLNRGDVSVADDVFLPDCIFHVTGVPEPIRGVGPWKEFIAGFLLAFPDLHLTVERQVIEGDSVAFHWRGTGTHTGPLGPVPATGKKMAIEGLIIDRLVDGKVQERWEQFDQSLMLHQLGLA
ncbi:ester cyclase [Synechococcus sp. Cruz-9H2]|uniref:ester cyclase n=1 Tax=unclassified Synechococcus TaxID=2626047 RepID=UPI0020CDF8F2|nr:MULTISPECIES: ester cyclase [unclassified Synechococcus]MCP9820532.1 ester cyclase [Synechococcus sp. Cruz-9H2]MCP9844831.1 ester cyclase [Synechococcus sp. Edmonson 11F2]MCP9856888.1 ester cyclase [Synechococcus sp. Cruz-9C9]MCP9864174.1 ester cyclase [Synechococcus sp. Cruz-7E5]MCP9871508.1 ester cyclase [Synechococcus sp. Cruz-7B9]